MENWQIIVIIVAVLVFVMGVVPLISYFTLTPRIIWKFTLTRSKPYKWSREYWEDNKDPEIRQMNSEGIAFREKNKDKRKEVEIVSEGFHLFGEFYDFGSDKCVLILCGREDTLIYASYYAAPYVESGYNILVVDPRAHGLSDGKYFGAGVAEVIDNLAWVKYVHDELGQKKVALHGVCLGGGSSVLLACREDCPDYVEFVTADGLFKSFYDIFASHVRSTGHGTWPAMPMIRNLMKKYTGADILEDSPINKIGNMKAPLLLLIGEKDQYVPNSDSLAVFDKCPTKKEVARLPKGAHSHFRISNVEEYDSAIKNWISKIDE